MNKGLFFKQLGIVTILAAVALFFLNQSTLFHNYQLLAWLSLAFFIALSLLMYIAGYKAAQSANKNDFTNVVLGSVMGKMLLSVLIIVVFNKWTEPADKFFLVPFFLNYLIFTIFETYVMMRLGRMPATSSSKP